MKFFSRRSAVPIDPDTFLERWREESQKSGWLRESDWYCSAARSVAVSITEDRDLHAPLRALASRRAIQGVGIAESLIDVQALFETSKIPQAKKLIIEFADAWVEATDLYSHKLTCWDSNSGLSNRQHFERRVHELRESPTTRDLPYVVALFRHLRTDLDEQTTFRLSADMGRACKDTMPEAIATYRGNRMALLVQKDTLASNRFDLLSQALGTVLESYDVPHQSLHLDVEPVPVRPLELQRLLGTLWR